MMLLVLTSIASVKSSASISLLPSNSISLMLGRSRTTNLSVAPPGSEPFGAWPRTITDFGQQASRLLGTEAPLRLALEPLQSRLQPSVAQAPVFEPSTQPVLPARVPIMRPLGQAGTTYVIAEGPAGLYLIDQHAAHERVLYERFDREVRAGRGVPVQPLLQPLTLDLTARQRAEIEPVLPLLLDVGFDLELVRGRENGLLIRAVPAMYADRVSLAGMLEMIDELLVGSPPDRWRDQLVITLACHSAIRAGKSLGLDEMRALVTQLEACTFPRLCAHGRPTMLHLSALQLEREFGRRP